MEMIIYYETDVYLDTHQTVPIQEPTAWKLAEQQLEENLSYHPVIWGNRFLIHREIRYIRLNGDTMPSAIFYDYMLRNNGKEWKREISVWKKHTKRDYHTDMINMCQVDQFVESY